MKGVTLIEMIAVITIIAIIVGISIPNFMIAVRNNRVRTRSIAMLNILRDVQSQAVSLNRDIVMQLDAQNKTYTVTRAAFTLYDPLSPDLSHPIILNKEDAEILQANVPFDQWNWLVDGVETDPASFAVTFTPSGTIQMQGVVIASVKLKGKHIGYEIELYRAGQIKFSQL
jgi:prepilin-type N-terminal cleavage/methylation domain-containing protein